MRIHLAGDDDEATEKAKRLADAEEKRAQNQLPTWIAQSTVSTGDDLSKSSIGATTLGDDLKPNVDEEDGEGGLNEKEEEEAASAALEAYYANLQQVDTSTPSAAVEQSITDSNSPAVFSPAVNAGTPIEAVKEETPDDEFDDISAAVEKGFEGNGVDMTRVDSAGKRSRDEEDAIEVNGKKAKVNIALLSYRSALLIRLIHR